MKKIMQFVKKYLFTFLFLILGIWLGFYAARINRAGVGGYIVLILISILYTFGIQQMYLKTTPAKVIGLFVGFALSFPIAYAIQYVVAFIKFGIRIASWFFGIPVVGPIAMVAILSIVGYTIYFIIDSIITARGVK